VFEPTERSLGVKEQYARLLAAVRANREHDFANRVSECRRTAD
jgi:hypothetical protein